MEYRESLKPLLEDLPPREKRILLLRFFGNMTQSQIAPGGRHLADARLPAAGPHPGPAAGEAARGGVTRRDRRRYFPVFPGPRMPRARVVSGLTSRTRAVTATTASTIPAGMGHAVGAQQVVGHRQRDDLCDDGGAAAPAPPGEQSPRGEQREQREHDQRHPAGDGLPAVVRFAGEGEDRHPHPAGHQREPFQGGQRRGVRQTARAGAGGVRGGGGLLTAHP
ncbi:hypothetical protein GCM10023238_20680 [Streptomyces heliomycini]